MKKDLFLILAILLLSQYYCDDDDDGPCFKMKVTGKEVCTGSEAGEGNHKCCFYKNEYEKKMEQKVMFKVVCLLQKTNIIK